VRKNSPDRVIEAVSEHLEVVRAIMARDAERARALMCAHLRKGLEYRTNLLLKRSRYAMPAEGELA
jgi:DNA-binding GntR family transcriptional regulator